MKAVVFEAFQGPLTLQTVPDPTPASHGVVLQVQATGLCRSDWHGWMGHDPDIRLPHVPGHELAGVIVEVGKEVRNFRIGDRVTIPFVSGCGHCPTCLTGHHQICDHQSQPGFTHWGSFAEYVALDYADINLVHLPEAIDSVTAATLGCRFVTSFRAIVDQAQVKAGQWVAIHGCGGVGLSAIMIAHAMGAQVIAVDIQPAALALARKLGAHHTLLSSSSNQVVDEIRQLTKGGVHVSLDALGSQETCFQSIACLRKRGKHIQVGLMTDDHQHPRIPMDRVLAYELEILGSHGMQAHRYPDLLGMILQGTLQPQQMIQQTITLAEAVKMLPRMNEFAHVGVTVIDSFQ